MTLTISQALRWLRKQRQNRKYYYTNGYRRPCLFTRIMRHYTGEKRAIVYVGGEFKEGCSPFGRVPFHDKFWDVTNQNYYEFGASMTRDEAIATLKKLS